MAPKRKFSAIETDAKLKSYEVEEILDHQNMEKFLIKWRGFEEPTWEPLANLDNCQSLLADFRYLIELRRCLEEADGHEDSSDELVFLEDGLVLLTPDDPYPYLASGSTSPSSSTSSASSSSDDELSSVTLTSLSEDDDDSDTDADDNQVAALVEVTN